MANSVDAAELQELAALVSEVKHNLSELGTEWKQFQQELFQDSSTDKSTSGNYNSTTVLISKTELDSLATETMILKEFLPKVLAPDLLSTYSQLSHIEQELSGALDERGKLSELCEQLERRTEAVLTDYEQEKREKFAAKCEAVDLTQQLSQQVDYCSSLGATCCSMLWQLSKQDNCVHTILSGAFLNFFKESLGMRLANCMSKVHDFLELVSSTLQSFLAAYAEELPSEESDQTQFILSLCGIVTNMAASPYGRDFLSGNESGRTLIDTLCLVLANTPNSQSYTKMKELMLMTLYNISINEAGLQYLSTKDDLMKILVWMLRDGVDSTNKLHCIMLLSSFVLEPPSPQVVHQAMEVIQMQLVQELTTDVNSEVREAAKELLSMLKELHNLPH